MNAINNSKLAHSKTQDQLFSRSMQSPAFTLTELLVVIAIVATLASLLLPSLGKAKARGQSIVCRNNLKQLQLAWQMYHEDNNDMLAPNELPGWGSPLLPGSWVVGNLTADKSVSNVQQGVLFRYVSSPAIYRCPADKSTIGNKRGGVPTIRHYSMSCYMNGKNPGSLLVTPPNYAVDWVFHRASHITQPPPSGAFVFIHEAGSTIPVDSGWFYLPIRWTWVSFPSNHQNGQNLSFADGHVEHWHWQDPDTLKTFKSPVDVGNGFSARVGNRDLARLLQATPGWWAAASMRPGSRPGQGGPDVFP